MKRIAIQMIEGLAAVVSGFRPPEFGDLAWSARAAKVNWLKCERQIMAQQKEDTE